MILYIAVLIFVIYFLNSKMITNNLGEISLMFVFLWKSIPLFFNFFKQASFLVTNKESYKKIMKYLKIFNNTNRSKNKITNFF